MNAYEGKKQESSLATSIAQPKRFNSLRMCMCSDVPASQPTQDQTKRTVSSWEGKMKYSRLVLEKGQRSDQKIRLKKQQKI